MIRELGIALVLLVALTSGEATDEKKNVLKEESSGNLHHYDWKQWFSKTGKPSEASKDGTKNWNKWTSYPHIDPPSGLSEKYSFSPYDWKQWLSDSEQLSKTGDDKGSGKDGYDWKNHLSNSYNQIPSGLEEQYSFSPYDWEKHIPGGVQYYDWQQWLSKSKGGKEDGFDWKKYLSNSYNQKPSGLEEQYSFSPYNWKQWVSQSETGISGKGKMNDGYDWEDWFSAV